MPDHERERRRRSGAAAWSAQICGRCGRDLRPDEPVWSTEGGTSDARFIKDACPVAEFGLVGQTMHQVDERTPTADLAALTRIYRAVLDRYFAA